MRYDDLEMVQINDGLTQTSASGNSVVYDKRSGLVFAVYITGIVMHYGESTGKICLSVFPASQPHNIRHRIIDTGFGQSRGLLTNAVYLVGDRKVRIVFATERWEGQRPLHKDVAVYYRDYDFVTDTVSERTEVFLRTDEGDVRIDNSAYRKYVEKYGYEVTHGNGPIVNKVTIYKNEIYTALTLDFESNAILCKIEDNVLVPFAICPELGTYEFRYFINDDGIFAVYRVAPDDHETGHGGYTVSRDGGKTWETTIFEDGVQSRPDIMEYYGKPLIIYNYKSEKSVQNFPRMHNFRNAIKFIYDGRVVLDLFSKYGFVEHETVSICGDLYMAFSNCPKALSTENGKAWIEDGLFVEQGKEASQWMKIGYLDVRK